MGWCVSFLSLNCRLSGVIYTKWRGSYLNKIFMVCFHWKCLVHSHEDESHERLNPIGGHECGECSDHFLCAASQWEMTLQCKVISHRLGTFTKWSLRMQSLLHIWTVNSLWWRHMATEVWVNIGSGNGLLPDGTKPLPEPMLTYHQ